MINVKSLQDIMRKDAGGVSGTTQELTQLVWIFFLKVFDTKEQEWELEDAYTPTIPIGYRWRDWVQKLDENGNKDLKNQLTGDELINFVNNDLFVKLKELEGNTTREILVRDFMQDAQNYMKKGVVLRELLNKIDNDIDFSDNNERHTFNEIYETLLKGLQSAKSAGEYYTGRALTKLVTDYVNPKIGEKVADFACGTGGFLVEAKEHLDKQANTLEDVITIQNSIYGIEWKPLPYSLAMTNLFLHDIENPNLTCEDSLSKDVRGLSNEEKFDCILMNPPFGGQVLDEDLTLFPEQFRTKESSYLFVVKIMYSLAKNGRCGLILPDGLLFDTNSNVAMAIKKKLIEDFNLHTIIRLPSSCFLPYTPISTNLLFFDNTKNKTKDIWFYRMDLENGQNFSMTKNPMTRDKFKCVDDWWNNRVEIKDKKEDDSMTETWKSKKINIDEIVKANYSLDFCGYPNKEKIILSPEETIKNFKEERERLDKEMDVKLDEILKLLGLKED